MKVELLEENKVDSQRLLQEIRELRGRHPEYNQFCITSETPNDLFTGAGKCLNAEDYIILNDMFKGSYLETLINEYNEFFRWRILCLPHKTTYTIHKDCMDPNFMNVRIHIPVVTNPDAYLVFYEDELHVSGKQTIEYHHLKEGNIYKVDTTDFHTGVNYSHDVERIPIVAEKWVPYE